jgi:hypothetical protein
MAAAPPAPTPSPSPPPVVDLFTKGLDAWELWNLLWPALAGSCLLLVGVAVGVGYVRQWLTGHWPPHWSRAVLGLAMVIGAVPAFVAFADRAETAAAEWGVPVSTFLLAVAAQLGLFDEEGRTRRRRR